MQLQFSLELAPWLSAFNLDLAHNAATVVSLV